MKPHQGRKTLRRAAWFVDKTWRCSVRNRTKRERHCVAPLGSSTRHGGVHKETAPRENDTESRHLVRRQNMAVFVRNRTKRERHCVAPLGSSTRHGGVHKEPAPRENDTASRETHSNMMYPSLA